jgi:AmmeMemoRadiSam system protein B
VLFMAASRPPAVAGSFYPADADALRASVREHLASARAASSAAGPAPKAIIVPHAGYVYSGSVAAKAYALLDGIAERVERVVLLGPSHHVRFAGLALPAQQTFHTPLGEVPVDSETREELLELPQVRVLDEAHHWEHALEVQLPFLQEVLYGFVLVPLVVGDASPALVADVLEACWGGDETLIVVSSDLSHYFDYGTAKRMDAATAHAIEALDPTPIGTEDACGRLAVQGLLHAARNHGLSVVRLELCNSGDTAGRREEVVGYGSWALR